MGECLRLPHDELQAMTCVIIIQSVPFCACNNGSERKIFSTVHYRITFMFSGVGLLGWSHASICIAGQRFVIPQSDIMAFKIPDLI